MRIFKVTSFIVLIFILISAAVYFNVYPLFKIAAALIVFAAADIFLFALSKGCVIHISTDKTEYRKNDKGLIKLSIKNRCLCPVSNVTVTLSIKNRYYKGTAESYSFPLGVLCGKNIRRPFKIVYNGIFDINIEKVEYTDMLGILKKSMSSGSKYSFVVFPKETESCSTDMTGAIDTDNIPSENVYSSNSGDISSFREYREGDRLNSINWKLTARMDDIYVREYERTSMDEAVVLLDMYVNNIDKALDELYAVLKHKRNFYVFWLPAGAEEFKSGYVSDESSAYDLLIDIYDSAPDMIANRGINEYKKIYKGHRFIYISSTVESVQ